MAAVAKQHAPGFIHSLYFSLSVNHRTYTCHTPMRIAYLLLTLTKILPHGNGCTWFAQRNLPPHQAVERWVFNDSQRQNLVLSGMKAGIPPGEGPSTEKNQAVCNT